MPAEVGSKVNTKAPNGEVREGEVILYDPDDDELTYKVKLSDGSADWFKRCCVALLGEDFPPEPVKNPAAEAEADKIEFSTAAPYLAAFFRKSAAFGAKTVEVGNLVEIVLNAHAYDGNSEKKLKDDAKAWYESEGKPLIEKSFHLHDSKKTGVLDKEEASVFFEHFFSAVAALAKYIGARQLQMSVQMMVARAEAESQTKYGMGLPPDMREATEGMIRHKMKMLKARVQTREDAYLANKDAFNAAAFKVLDTSGDGSIQLTELVAAFEPDSVKSLEFHMALGFTSEEEAKMCPSLADSWKQLK